jgi:hypothetical protein
MKIILLAFFAFMQSFFLSIAYGQITDKTPYVAENEASYQTNKIIACPSRHWSVFKDSLYLVSRDSKFGIIDSTGSEVVPLIYEEINVDFSIREAVFYQIWYSNEYFNNYWQDGHESEEVYAQLLEIEINNPKSYLNVSKKFRSNPFFPAKKGNQWGVINKSNEIIIPFRYSFIEEIGEDIFLAKKEGKSGIINSENDILMPLICDSIVTLPLSTYGKNTLKEPSELEEPGNYALIKLDNKYGAINLFTQKIISPKYENLEQCFFLIESGCRCGFINDSSWFDFTPDLGYNTHAYNNVLRYQIGNKLGLINMARMQEVTPPIFDSIQFGNGSSAGRFGSIVYLDGKYTFLTNENVYLHPNLYDEVYQIGASRITPRRYRDPYLAFYKVKNDGHWGILKENGEKFISIEWDDIIFLSQMKDTSTYELIVKRKGKYGVINNRQQIIIPIKYDSISREHDSGYYYLLHRKGRSKKVLIE